MEGWGCGLWGGWLSECVRCSFEDAAETRARDWDRAVKLLKSLCGLWFLFLLYFLLCGKRGSVSSQLESVETMAEPPLLEFLAQILRI